MEVPFTKPGTWPDGIDPARMAAHIHRVLPVACRVAILGLADDLGVRLNHGRAGAAAGPTAFRAALARYGVAHPPGWTWPVVLDAGDIIPAHGHDEVALRETHDRVTAAVTALLDLGLFPIGIGGGHDLTFPFVRAVAVRARTAGKPLASGVYFDAHLDVREHAGSGMAFRRLVEDCGVRTLHVHGHNPLVNSREHHEWFAAHGGKLRRPGIDPLAPREPMDMQALGTYQDQDDPFPPGPCFASLDLDVLDAAHAPGVSAINPAGWAPQLAQAWMLALGRRADVRCLDIMELNPALDHDGRTARIAAHLFLTFLRGLCERPA